MDSMVFGRGPLYISFMFGDVCGVGTVSSHCLLIGVGLSLSSFRSCTPGMACINVARWVYSSASSEIAVAAVWKVLLCAVHLRIALVHVVHM